MSIKDQINEYILEFVTYGEPIDGDDASLIESDLIDSTGVMELVMFLEETFGITVEDEDIDPANFETVNLVSAFVERKKEVA
jgi:acyl carrier protein